MQFQGRGNVVLQRIGANGLLGPGILICPDTLSLDFAADSFEHINKCGLVDVPDYRGTKSLSATLNMSFAEADDLKFAIASLGTKTVAGSPGTVTGELLPTGMIAGDIAFLGGKTRHRAITGLILTDSASPPATVTLTTKYTVEAERGRVTIVNPSPYTQPFKAAYGYTDPQSVSLLSAAQGEFFASFEFYNKASNGDQGSLELFKVRFDPAQNLDFMSDELQIYSLVGSVLADTSRDATNTEFGQFGRRVL